MSILKYEDEFYRILGSYLNLERNTARKYTDNEYNLNRMPVLAELFGFPEKQLQIIHIAGTKGKGSVCGYATAFLCHAGKRVGTFTSPHLTTFRERFLIDGKLPDYETILSHTRNVEQTISPAGIDATFFEVLTLLALSFFVDQGCEYAILETGIGGRLDCTNYISSPVCTAITSISFDHTQLLGSTITEIAAEKAGIIKPGIPVVCGSQPFEEAREMICRTAADINAPVVYPTVIPPLPQFDPLPPFQHDNLAIARQICDVCGIPSDLETFTPPSIPGRFQLLRDNPPVIIDAAHNADSAKRLVEGIQKQYPEQRFTCVLGIVSGKDTAGILNALSNLNCSFIFTNPRVEFKGSELKQLEALGTKLGLNWQTIPAITRPDPLPADIPMLFTGSFFTATIGAELFGSPSTEF